MALIDITPIMTSNTTPSPYVVTASNYYNSSSLPYNLFDNNSKTKWSTADKTTTGWVSLDFGSNINVSAFSIKCGNSSDATSSTQAPRSFSLYGSNDNSLYELICNLPNEILWSYSEERLFRLPTTVSFRYYKLLITSNNGNTFVVSFSELKFYQDDGVTPPSINAKYQTQRRSLPHGSKLRLDNLTSDLPYMLGVEDDGINEGTFRLVNHAGKFIIPMAGIKTESIWKGSITKDEIATLSKSISNFKLLIIEIKSGNGLINYISVPVNNIVLNKTDYLTSIPWIPTYYCSGRYGFLTEYTFTITDSANVGMGVFTVTEIIGIY